MGLYRVGMKGLYGGIVTDNEHNCAFFFFVL